VSAQRAELLAAPRSRARSGPQVTLTDLLDRLLQGGVVIQGQVVLSAADIDLVEVDLSVVVAAVEKLAGR
jgi:Gas vesicle protein